MKPNHRIVWVTVEYIKRTEIPVEVPFMNTRADERHEAMRIIAARSPADRLPPGSLPDWRYTVSEDGV